MADVFISYTKADSEAAALVASALAQCGYSVFYDADLASGDSWDSRIEHELMVAGAVVVLWSPNSRDRQWVRNEAREAMRRSALCPALIQRCEIPLEFSHVQTTSLMGWNGQNEHVGWLNLQRAIGEKCGRRNSLSQEVSYRPHTAPETDNVRRIPESPHNPISIEPHPLLTQGRGALVAVAAIVGIMTIVGGYYFWSQSQNANGGATMWGAVDANSADALRAYIAGNPGNYRDDAVQSLAILEERSFEAASDADTIEALEAFINDFPESEHAIAARGRIAELQMAQPAATPDPSAPVDPNAPGASPDPDLVPPGLTAPTP